ncbi:alpha/beta family hydrolase [Halobacillus naozhouensis]|uniref:Alpha/beta hydrolase n=1 Tax=Halobacillus naozhouensis TaxID=554880 RepID=A0ABY8J697_9BACI|nr:alpha/beta family hydrolase [Halobacillus naozhouensis]WFT76481.1 alpha/beta hydrolase [Halobacillus naozhouensis]
MKVNIKSKMIGDKEIQYTHIQNNSKVVCIMFSGAGYTYDKPLFYYSTMKLIEGKIDIVHIHYSYSQDELNLPIAGIADIITNDVEPIIDEVLNCGEYRESIYFGKSIGTIPIINEIMVKHPKSTFVLLTPLLKYELFMRPLLESQSKILIIAGSKDHHYVLEKIEALMNKNNIKVKVVNKANHSLEIEPFDTLSSISSLSDTIQSISRFIR